MMKVSLIICSRNRARSLADTLAWLERSDIRDHHAEVVLVDNGSSDGTGKTMHEFADNAKFPVTVVSAPRPGLGIARNAGLRHARGEIVAFTDDDCYVTPRYFSDLISHFLPDCHQYGMGSLLLFDAADDPRVAIVKFDATRLLPAFTVLTTGSIAGANMFFIRSIFEQVGYFNEALGAGTEFDCEDIEMATRASLAGFAGVQLPKPVIYHHHRRKLNSEEALRTIKGYDRGRGAYYASLLLNGVPQVWDLWAKASTVDVKMPESEISRQAAEFQGAADFLLWSLNAAVNNRVASSGKNYLINESAQHCIEVGRGVVRDAEVALPSEETQLQDLLAKKEAEIGGILRSRSWRITAPLRSVSATVKYLTAKLKLASPSPDNL
jgi:glycosyltransferase involved in cell wall biosynthesis